MNPKQLGIGLAVLGVVLIIASGVILSFPDNGKWVPVFLIAGGAMVWAGVHKYRWA